MSADGKASSARKKAKRSASSEKRQGVPMVSTPLYTLSWREYAKGESGTYGVIRSQSHSIDEDREAVMSLFAALTSAPDFYDVKVERSSSMRYSAALSASGSEDEPDALSSSGRDSG